MTSSRTEFAPADLLVEHLDVIHRLARHLCRRHGMSPSDAEDFASLVQLKLVEDDYAIIRRFRGESSFTTYLSVVVAMIFRDHRAAMWGRWRPSTIARRHGDVAVHLETLLYRDGLSFAEAVGVLRSRGFADITERRLVSLVRELPRRTALRPTLVSEDAVAATESASHADDTVAIEELEEAEREIATKVNEAVKDLPCEDRVMLCMHVVDGLTLAEVSRSMGVPQKPLYRRMERLLRGMRERLERAGITRERASLLIRETNR